MRLVLAAGLSLLCVGAALALFGPAALLSGKPAMAATFNPLDRGLAREAARVSVQLDDRPAAAAFGRQTVRAMPLDPFGLATASIEAADADRTAALNVAAAMGWRDPATNNSLLVAALTSREPAIAAQRLDALGRTFPEAVDGALLDRVLAMPGGVDALAGRLARHASSPWWAKALRDPPRGREAAMDRIALLRTIGAEDGTMRRRLVESAAIGIAEPALALALWRATIGREGSFAGFVYDPDFADFDPARRSLGGEWLVPRNSPALYDPARSQGGLRLEVQAANTGTMLVQQLAAEQGTAILESVGNGSGAQWLLRCVGKRGRADLLRTDAPTGRWQVEIPAGCDVAELSLAISPGADSKVEIELERVSLSPGT